MAEMILNGRANMDARSHNIRYFTRVAVAAIETKTKELLQLKGMQPMQTSWTHANLASRSGVHRFDIYLDVLPTRVYFTTQELMNFLAGSDQGELENRLREELSQIPYATVDRVHVSTKFYEGFTAY